MRSLPDPVEDNDGMCQVVPSLCFRCQTQPTKIITAQTTSARKMKPLLAIVGVFSVAVGVGGLGAAAGGGDAGAGVAAAVVAVAAGLVALAMIFLSKVFDAC